MVQTERTGLMYGLGVSLVSVLVLTGVFSSLAVPEKISGSDDKPSSRPPIVLVVMESVRADHMGRCYGYKRRTSPNICNLSEDAVLFEKAYSQGSRTIISMPSLLTGGNPAKIAPYNATRTLPDNAVTIDRRLREVGYETKGYGTFDRIYGEQDPFMEERLPLQDAAEEMVLGRGIFTAWFPFLTHIQYVPDDKYRKWEDIPEDTFEQIKKMGAVEYYRKTFGYRGVSRKERTALYDETILQMDARVGTVISRLKERNIYNESLIIVTADHGERLKPNEAGQNNPKGLPHGGEPERRVTHVPLIIKFPGNRYAGKRISMPVRHIDIAPTIYDFLNVSAPRIVDDESLLKVINGQQREPNPVYSARLPDEDWALHRKNKSVYIDLLRKECGNKTVLERIYEKMEAVFPPGGEAELSRKEMRQKLCSIYRDGMEHRSRFESRGGEVKEEIKERLENLGYLR